MFWRTKDPLPAVAYALPIEVFHLTAIGVHHHLPQGWRASFAAEDYKDITTPNPTTHANRLKLYRFGVLMLDLADIRHQPPFPTTYSLIKAPEDIKTRILVASLLTTLASLAENTTAMADIHP